MSLPENVQRAVEALRRNRGRGAHEEVLMLCTYVETTSGEVPGGHACRACGVVITTEGCPVCHHLRAEDGTHQTINSLTRRLAEASDGSPDEVAKLARENAELREEVAKLEDDLASEMGRVLKQRRLRIRAQEAMRAMEQDAARAVRQPVLPEGSDAALKLAAQEAQIAELSARCVELTKSHERDMHAVGDELRLLEAARRSERVTIALLGTGELLDHLANKVHLVRVGGETDEQLRQRIVHTLNGAGE